MTASAKYNFNNEKVYADDALQETDKTFIDGTITVGIYGLTVETRRTVLGHAASESGTGFTGTDSDEAPYIGHGFYGRKSGGKWKAIWYPKVQFSDPADEMETKGEKTVFKTPALEGAIMRDDNGAWIDVQEFSTEAAAKAWLDNKTGIVETVATPVASVASGTYATTQSATITCATVGASIYYTTNGTTPSATNGTLYSTAVSIAASSALRAIAIKSSLNNSNIAEYEYIITA